jgi:dihydrolipoamide dehydrogenase
VLHEAARQGRIAGRNAAAFAASGEATEPKPWTALAMVFTQPETASVGAPYEAESGRVVGSADFRDQGRARVEARNRGGLRIWADRRGLLLGAEMMGSEVEHLAHLLAFAIEDGLTAERLRDRPYYHPTIEEGFDSALAEITRACADGSH